MEELFGQYTFACGTVHSNRRGLPVAVTKAKLKKGETVFQHKDAILCMKYYDRREVCLLSTIHDATEILVYNRRGMYILKSELIVEYNWHMKGCDLADQLMTSYSFLQCNFKWWRKMFFHLFSLLLNNAYILNKKYGKVSLSHEMYLEYIAEYLIKSSTNSAMKLPKPLKVLRPTPNLEK